MRPPPPQPSPARGEGAQRRCGDNAKSLLLLAAATPHLPLAPCHSPLPLVTRHSPPSYPYSLFATHHSPASIFPETGRAGPLFFARANVTGHASNPALPARLLHRFWHPNGVRLI
jgi:hypothetical protein